jgi:hypothetical protein
MVNSLSFLLDHLAYLHDAKCLEITWDCSHPSHRMIRMLLVVSRDAELPAWNGQTLQITLSSVLATQSTFWSTFGIETVDSWRPGISAFLEQQCLSLSSKGITIPPLKFTISFHSGSEIEVVCDNVNAVVKI